jgi:hypothetical protein
MQDFKLGGAKKSYFFQLRREARKYLGYFVWKITILRQKILFFPILGGERLHMLNVRYLISSAYYLIAMFNGLHTTLMWRHNNKELWYLTPPSTIFQLYRGDQYYWCRQPEYPEKTADPPQANDNFYHIMLYRVHITSAGFDSTSLVVIDTGCICSCKSHYHTITITRTPQ